MIPHSILSSRVDGNSHKWIDARKRGKIDELIGKKKKSRRIHSAPPSYQGKKSSCHERVFTNGSRKEQKTVHDVPLLPETRAVRRLQHSTEAIARNFHIHHPINVINLPQSTPCCTDGVFFDDRPSVKMKLVNIWNSKLQTQGKCTSTHDGESKEKFAPKKNN